MSDPKIFDTSFMITAQKIRIQKHVEITEKGLDDWFENVTLWWENEKKLVEEWNEKLLNSKLENYQEYIMSIPESYKPCIEEIREIYHSNLKRDSRIKFMIVMLSNLEDLAKLVQEKLASFNKICNRLLEELKQEKIIIQQNDTFDFPEIKNAVCKIEDKKYIEEIINLFQQPL